MNLASKISIVKGLPYGVNANGIMIKLDNLSMSGYQTIINDMLSDSELTVLAEEVTYSPGTEGEVFEHVESFIAQHYAVDVARNLEQVDVDVLRGFQSGVLYDFRNRGIIPYEND